ncbi:hypothetical protein CHS0354_025030 [Potamilus streckersoni]|uniref:Ig-like domain-containing protein n=1 Tax=Potamilus streckersoni TaxID=2493646 RepID=A0AAE0WA95_9BIVA|nr:hypothetical protein CHS0354_025030 [Potamilus streckersoni]
MSSSDKKMRQFSFIVILGFLQERHCIQLLRTTFDSTPANVTVIAGKNAILPCTVQNKGDYQVIWMNTNKVLISTEDRRVIDDVRMSIERPFVKDWNLYIRNVELKDRGTYTCQVNTNPIQIKRIYLNILVPATIIEKTSSPNIIVVDEGETVQMMCNATGFPEPSVTWFRRTKQQAKEYIGTKGEMLIIHNISRHCVGVYECVVDNGLADPVSKDIIVDVEFAPEVELRTSRIGQYRGLETILECIVSASPQAISLWMKGDNQVFNHSTNWKYRTDIYKENEHTLALYLRILNLEEDDYGLYTCMSSNRLGHDSKDVLLYEYLDPTTRGPFRTKVTEINEKITSGIHGVYNKIKLKDKEFEYQTTYKSYNVRQGHNKKPYAVYNTGYAGTGDLYNNGVSLCREEIFVAQLLVYFVTGFIQLSLGR